MAFKMNNSKFRLVNGKIDKRENWYPDIATSNSSSANTMVKASAEYVAVNWQSGTGTLGIIPLSQVGKRKEQHITLHAHSGQLSDFEFSPFSDSTLATASDDATLKLWNLQQSAADPVVSLAGHTKAIDCIQFNPTALNVLASGSADKTVRVWDIGTGQERQNISCFDNSLTGIAWNYDGSLLAAVSKDLKNRVIDPRSNSAIQVGDGHQGIKPSRVTWLGNSHYFLTTGFAKSRERQISIWDSRDLAKVVKSITLDSSTGIVTPIYDIDTQLLFVAGVGDSTTRCFDLNTQFTAEPALAELVAVPSDTPTKGICSIPKRALEVMEGEIFRLLKLTANSIVPITYRMSRISYSEFKPDLYPNSASLTPALTADEWFNGETKVPVLASLNPALRQSGSASPDSASVENLSINEQAEESHQSSWTPSSTSLTGSGSNTPTTTTAAASSSPSLPDVPRTGIIPKIVRTSKYRHINVAPFPKTSHYTNLKVFGNTSNTSIAVNSEYVAVPWVGTGGPLAVIPLSQVGRQVTVPCIEIGSQLLDFDLSQFNPSVVATGSEDSHIKLWRIPEGGLPKNNKVLNYTNFETDLIGHNRKIVSVNFHPTAENVLISTGGDMSLKLWDVQQGQERFSFDNQHNDIITSVNVSSKGDLFLTACKDKMMRIIDPRTNTLVDSVQSHNGVKGSKALWCGDKSTIFSVGFNKSSEREYQLWDSRNFGAGPMTTGVFDHLAGVITPYYDEDTGVVYLVGKGDGSIRMMEINDQEPYVHFLTEYSSGVPQMGVAPVSKHLLNIKKCEIARFFKVSDTTVEPLQFSVPRTRTEFFQDDIFVPTRVSTPTMSADEWFNGASVEPERVSLCPSDMSPLSTAPPPVKKEREIRQEIVEDDTPSRDQVINTFLGRVLTQREDDEPVVKKQSDSPCVSDSEWD
ncbi:WD-40 repeat-containing protein [Heterostelium album PN500]|uniref:Coronin n=1 Tax=Heterostelium pallidum (strain ATCC 26659 / Pp 5 / PN500) TaxID=670386 RepID=D3BC07_HETP5|nr:WD-40 repeat-containing protein [Heterostelium album PN500]EFA81190.1 WD-40 repeat-containing protein [Heterostelium album PN500]|eukprot:XP_020433308.1 WD-40 repeat-containing protein [Heterostelium album PN500]